MDNYGKGIINVTPVFIDEIEMFLKSIYPYVNGYNISDESDWRTV